MTATPGWYPDPAGASGQYRYWDGANWSHSTTSNPGGYSTPGPGGGGGKGSKGGGSNTNLIIGIIIAVVLIAIAAVVIVLFVRNDDGENAQPDHNSAAPTVSAWDENPTPSRSSPTVSPTLSGPSPTDTGGEWISCPVVDDPGRNDFRNGRAYGGDLSMNLIEDGSWSGGGFNPSWVHDYSAQYKIIIRGWMSSTLVGEVRVEDGFENPQIAAQRSMDCFATSAYYTNYSGRDDLRSEEITVDGHPGWWERTRIYIDSPDMPQIDGDVVDIVVVDTGKPGAYSIYIGTATIDDDYVQEQVDEVMASLKVEG